MNLISGSNSLPYGIVPSAPASLYPVDIDKWKARTAPEFKHYFNEKYNELMKQYNLLVEEYYINKLMYESDINFEPIIGKTYYLYERNNGARFISMLAHNYTKWNGYLGAYRLKAQFSWEKVE
jgi:hypothetical protein